MGVNLKLTAAHALNAYFFDELKKNNVFDANDYPAGASFPFIPDRQRPAFTELPGGPPFVVYSYNDPMVDQEWYTKNQTVAYYLYSNDNETALEFNTLAHMLFDEYDDTAERVNKFIAANPQFAELHFKYVHYTGGGSPTPPSSEEGRFETLVTITARYSRDLLF